jgi:uncharacterized protein (TIGR03437 family)
MLRITPIAIGIWAAATLLARSPDGPPDGQPDRPALSAGDVVNAADYSGGRVAPGEIVVLFPSHVGPAVLAGAQIDGEGRVTTLLGETRVLFDGIAAPIVYSVSGEVSAIAPYTIANRKTTQVVVEYQGVGSPPVELSVVSSAPALFTSDSSGKGQAGMLNETGCCNSARNPAIPGSIASLYATGAGQTSPPGIDGSVAAYDRIAEFPVPALPVQVMVGGQQAEIIYAGAAPHAVAGLLQVNFRVPSNAPTGDAVPLVLTVGNARSPDGVTMAVRSPAQRILVVDDGSAMRNRLSRVLAGAGYDVVVARNGREALDRAGEHPIDLVICSLTIPEKERLEAIRTMVKARPQLKIIATVGASGLGSQSATLRAADLLGAQAVLTNPMAAKAVLQRVREVLRPRAARY